MFDYLPSSEILIPASKRVFGEGPMEFMREKTSALYEMTPINAPSATGRYSSKRWYFEQGLITQAENDPMVVGRSKAQAETGAGLVFIHRYLRGGIRGVTGATNIDRSPGQMYLLDQACRVNCIQSSVLAQGIYLPKSLIGYDPNKHSQFIGFGAYGAAGATLYRTFDLLLDRLNSNNAIDRHAYDDLIALLKLILNAGNEEGDVRRRARNALAQLIRAHIERHLDDTDLTATTLLKTFGLSRATLFRIFESEGGVRHYIQGRRLSRAVIDIARSQGARGVVTEAAMRWGFSSCANFNRAIRNTYGVAPGSLIDATTSDIRYSGGADDIHAFVRRTEQIAA